MIAVSNDFKNAMKSPVKELQAYINADDVEITDDTDLIEWKISVECGLCRTAMRKLEAKYLGTHNLVGQWVQVGFGVRLENGSFEYLDYGSFLVTEMTESKDTEVTTIVGYDKMINSMTAYTPLEVNYPVGLYDYTVLLCNACGLTLANESFDTHNDWLITKELWENINGITYRDILTQIAQVTATTCIISDDTVLFKKITDTNEELTYDNMLTLKLEPMYGEINSVVLARDPIVGEDVFLKDDASIQANGLTEFKISNNEIVDKDRENAITPIYNALKGITYYPFDTNTEGLGWYEIGDSFTIVNDAGDEFNTTLFNFSLTLDGSLKETLKSVAETKTQAQYQYASKIDKRIKNTEILVNKQEQYIDALVTDMYSDDGVINEKFTEVRQDLTNIINSVQNSGGNNLLINSVMFAYDEEGIPSNWVVGETGTLRIDNNQESLTKGGLSGHSFTLIGKTVRQRVFVKSNDDTETKTYYTFSCRIKKDAIGTCYVRIYNENEEYRIDLGVGDVAYYKEYEISKLLPTSNYYDIEFYGSADSTATFTDNMFAMGEYKTQWTQANGEIMNTQVNINVDGVLVKSSVYLGDYTVMSPLEFAGYSNINGRITRVFSLNKDVTTVTKLRAEDEITMTPIKIVPVNSGDLIGWAFVPST